MDNVPVLTQSVKFINIKSYVINFDKPKRINVEFFVDQKVKVTSKDWIAIFPRDCDFWNSVNFDLIVTYEFILDRPINSEEKHYKIPISLKGAKNLTSGQEYQFVYYNRFSEVLGVSDLFEFLEPMSKEVRPKTAVNVMLHNNNEEREHMVQVESFIENIRGINDWSSQDTQIVKDKMPIKVFEDSDKGEVDIVDHRGRYGYKNRKNKQGFINKVHQMAISTVGSGNSQLVSRRMALTTSCTNCQRVDNLLKIQAKLYLEIKNLAERNSDQEKEISCLKKQIELTQAAYQKLSVTLKHEQESKLFFQAEPRESAQYQITWVYQQFLLGFDNFRRPIYANHPVMQFAPHSSQQVLVMEQDPPVTTHQDSHRLEDKTKLSSSLKLKAIIGSQENTIRMLTEKLAQLEAKLEAFLDPVQKVKAVLHDVEIGAVDCVNQQLNNVGVKAVENHS